MNKEALSLRDFNRLFPDAEAARAWFEESRWPDGPVCSDRGSVGDAYWLKSVRRWRCKGCSKQFTVTAGTPMHRTHLPLLSGIVEIDETYAGAPPRKRAKPERDDDDSELPPQNPTGRGTKRPLLLVAAERGGDLVTRVISTHGKSAIATALDGLIDPEATVVTDGLAAYKHIGRQQPHLSVNHSDRQYARTDVDTGLRVHVNRVESFNGFLGRAVVGVFHFVSPKHLGRYAGEAAFRWNRKADACLERMARLIRNGEGRSLSYGFLTGAA